jgi:hypothetical protein
MKDTLASPGLPAELPEHLRGANVRLRAALGLLDQSVWHFAIKQNVLVAVRPWRPVAIDTLGVVGPDVVVATRHLVDGPVPVWQSQGTVERMVRAIQALGPPPEGLSP